MRRPLLPLAFLLLLVSNCEHRSTAWFVEPVPSVTRTKIEMIVQGTVRRSGSAVDQARVWLAGDKDHAVFTDAFGRYALPIAYTGSDSLRVVAIDGYTPGIVYGVRCSGSTRFLVTPWGAVDVDIVLDQCSPI